MRRRWRIGLPGACEHWCPEWPLRGLSAHYLECALISMMARSTTRSNQRPDTLMQDRICQVDETPCNARPDHTSGSFSTELGRPCHVRLWGDLGNAGCPGFAVQGIGLDVIQAPT